MTTKPTRAVCPECKGKGYKSCNGSASSCNEPYDYPCGICGGSGRKINIKKEMNEIIR